MDEWISDDDMDAIGDGLSEIWQAQREAELENQAPGEWLCPCGHYQEDGDHCASCGKVPPWGCECGCGDEEEEPHGYLDILASIPRHEYDSLIMGEWYEEENEEGSDD